MLHAESRSTNSARRLRKKPRWLERGPIVVGYDAVRIVRLKSGELRTEAWQPERQIWLQAKLPSDIVLRAAPANAEFLATINLSEADCVRPPA